MIVQQETKIVAEETRKVPEETKKAPASHKVVTEPYGGQLLDTEEPESGPRVLPPSQDLERPKPILQVKKPQQQGRYV